MCMFSNNNAVASWQRQLCFSMMEKLALNVRFFSFFHEKWFFFGHKAPVWLGLIGWKLSLPIIFFTCEKQV